MEISIHSNRGVRVAVLQGELDWAAVRSAEQHLSNEAVPSCKIILDLSGVSYMGSGGLRLLLSVFRRAHENKGRVVLVGLSSEIREVMELTGFLSFFRTFDTVEDGIAVLNS